MTFYYLIFTTVTPYINLTPEKIQLGVNLVNSTVALSLATNLTATLLIGYKFWLVT